MRNVTFAELNLGDVRVLKDVETNEVLGTIVGHCRGWNYTARYVDPKTKMVVSEEFERQCEIEDYADGYVHGAEKMSDRAYKKAQKEVAAAVVYDSFDDGKNEEEALDAAKEHLLTKCSEIYGELNVVDAEAAVA